MTGPRRIAATVHDVIDDVTTTAAEIHKSVADVPLQVLGEITPFKDTLEDVKETQDRTIDAIYGLIRSINGQVRRLTTNDAA